jgi:hypothetical protein
MTSEALLKLELSAAQNEIQRLRDQSATVPPTVHKIFFISLIPKWSVTESAVSLVEFFSIIEGSARNGHCLEAGCLQVAVLGLVDNVRTFYNS